MLIEVAVSGAVGKQTIPTTKQVELEAITLTPSGATATLQIRDGNASGEVVLFGRAMSANGSTTFCAEHKFTKGMHVKVIGTNAVAYLELE